MKRYRMRFEKTGKAVYISHLDLMRTFQRAFLRAGVGVKHTEGFNPHAYISIALPLSVGAASYCELLDFELPDGFPAKGLAGKLNDVLPEGIRALDIYIPSRKPKEIAFVCCEIILFYDKGLPADAAERTAALFSRKNLTVCKKTKKGCGEADIIPMVKTLEIACVDSGSLTLKAVVAAQNPSLNPELLAAALTFYEPSLAPDYTRVTRTGVLDAELKEFKEFK